MLILIKRPSHRKWCLIYYLTVSSIKTQWGFLNYELWSLKFEVQSLNSLSLKKSEVAYIDQSLKFKDQSWKSEGRGLSEAYPKSKIRKLSLKFKVWSSNFDVWSSKSVRSLKSEVWNSKSEVQNIQIPGYRYMMMYYIVFFGQVGRLCIVFLQICRNMMQSPQKTRGIHRI